jgi:hypothetical protein
MTLAEDRWAFEIVDRRACAFWTSVRSPFDKRAGSGMKKQWRGSGSPCPKCVVALFTATIA